METDQRDLSNYDVIIFEIDKDNRHIDQFDDDTLFMNIYNFYCFSHYLSPYYSWEEKVKERLKQNIYSSCYGNSL